MAQPPCKPDMIERILIFKSMKFIAPVVVVMITCLELKAGAQDTSPECMGANLGALIGVLINPRANISTAVPAHCRGGGMSQPSSSQQNYRGNSNRYIEQQELRNRQIQRNADINLDSIRDSNCLASSEGCVRIRQEY
jgi:hypothetical protein